MTGIIICRALVLMEPWPEYWPGPIMIFRFFFLNIIITIKFSLSNGFKLFISYLDLD